MVSRLPQWIGIGAWTLAFVAGMVNVVGFLSFEHQAVTHLTGTTSLLAAATVARGVDAWHLLLVILSFVGGSALSGLIIGDSTLKLGRRYGLALLLEAVMLGTAVPLLKSNLVLGTYLASSACGLQNAMASTYSGSVIRTSHVSGMFTDLGIFLGQACRGIPFDSRRLFICLIIISGFFAGGLVGAACFERLSYDTLLVPCAITGVAGISYGVYKHWRGK